ncbi:MAG: calcium-binding protein [Verrucomicrobia bacterium]|nr:calcium-binding protein [Verrucomicrobiota bacterium]
MKKLNRNAKKKTRSSLRVETLEQRQLLAGITGGGTEVGSNIVAPNGNVYDQVLMTGSSVSVTADAGQITRVSFLDLSGDIVQAEFSGKGTLTVSLDSFGAAAAPTKYNQPGVSYVSGLASFTISGSDATTNFSVFSVGTGNAHRGADNPIFADGKLGGNNIADVQRITVVADPANANGSAFGGIRAGNAAFVGSSGVVGISAANVAVQDVVTIGDIYATDSASPSLAFGSNSQFGNVTVAGGDLLQGNSKTIANSGYKYDVVLAAGTTSGGAAIAAQDTYSKLSFTQTPASVAAAVAAANPAVSPTFTLTAGATAVNEGASVIFTLQTTNVAAGTQYSYSLAGVSASDVTGGALTGTVTIGADGKALIPVSLVADSSTEGVETVTVSIAGREASATVNDTSLTPVASPLTIALTTGVDTGANFVGAATNDIFNAALSGAVATLNNLDVLDGSTGTDTLNVELNGVTVTPAGLTSIEQINVTSTANNSALDLTNATGVTGLTSSASTGTLSLNNIPSTTPAITIANSKVGHTIGFTAAAVAGAADTVSVTLNNVTASPLLTIGAGVETLALTVVGANDVDTAFAGAVTISGAGTLTLTAADNAAVAATTIDASASTGALTVAMSNAAHTVTGGSGADNITGASGTANRLIGGEGANTIVGGTGADTITVGDGNNTITTGGGADTVTAGAGNDSVTGGGGAERINLGAGNNTVTAGSGDDSITAGAGNDRFIFAAAGDLTVADTLSAGDGTDTLVVTQNDITTNEGEADTADLRALQAGMAEFEIVEISNAIAANATTINVGRLGANISRVDVTAANAGAATITLNPGSNTLNLNVAGNALAGALTVQDTGTATTDSITIVNANANNSDRFGGNLANILGFETVTINTGSTSVATVQTTGAIALTADGTNTAATVNVIGANILTLGAITTTGTGRLTIDASGMTARAAGTTTITVTAPVVAVGGTVSIKGSSGQDVLNGDADTANTIDGGAGVDTIAGGTAADSLLGGDGNDTISTNGGNDTVYAGAGNDAVTGGAGNERIFGEDGNDTITSSTGNDSIDGGAGNDRIIVGTGLTSSDTIVGGEGTDTLVIGQAITAADASQTSGFEILEASASVSQDLFNLVMGNTLTGVQFTADADMTFTNAGASTNSVVFGVATTGDFDLTFDRLIDNTSNSLTLTRSVDADIVGDDLAVDDEETLVINTAATTANRAFTFAELISTDLAVLTLSGNGTIQIDTLTTAALATIDASAITGTVNLGGTANTSAVAMTVTTGAGAATVVGGTGADTMTAGAGAVAFTGGAGADTLTGGAGADVLTGGDGADSLSGGAAADILIGGAGADTLTGGAGADEFRFAASTEGSDTITDFSVADGDLIGIPDAIINPAGSAAGAAYVADDFETTRNGIADIVAADTLHIIRLATAQTTAQIETITAGNANAVVLVFNSTTGFAELWYDNDWSNAANRVKLATLSSITTLAGTAAITNARFINR